MATSETSRVLIIGGGLGGLVLAQSLRKRDIPFDIFERDPSPVARSQGWAISLQPDLMDELNAATSDTLPPLGPVSHLNNSALNSEMTICDATTMQEVFRRGADHGTPFLRASRGKLRDWLLTDLQIHWGKRFTHYEEDNDGVTAFFADGSSSRGTILVGADGVSSHVRNQLLPDPAQHPSPLPFTLIVGELTAPRTQYEQWMKYGHSLFSGNTPTGRVAVALAGLSDDLETARYYWLLGWADEEALKDDHWVLTASQEELHKVMLQRLEGIHPGFADIIRQTPVEGMLHPPLRLRDMVPPELPRGRVTLLGDACHPMTPFRGEGGNMAMTDGMRMAGFIAQAVRGDDGSVAGKEALLNALKAYEDEMRPRATKSVLGSRANAYKNPAS